MQDFTVEVNGYGSIVEKWKGYNYRKTWVVRVIDNQPVQSWEQLPYITDHMFRVVLVRGCDPCPFKRCPLLRHSFYATPIDVSIGMIMNTRPLYLLEIKGICRRLKEIPSLQELALEKIDTFETTWFEKNFPETYNRLMKPKFSKKSLNLDFITNIKRNFKLSKKKNV